jgi:hypothetical protein
MGKEDHERFYFQCWEVCFETCCVGYSNYVAVGNCVNSDFVRARKELKFGIEVLCSRYLQELSQRM